MNFNFIEITLRTYNAKSVLILKVRYLPDLLEISCVDSLRGIWQRRVSDPTLKCHVAR